MILPHLRLEELGLGIYPEFTPASSCSYSCNQPGRAENCYPCATMTYFASNYGDFGIALDNCFWTYLNLVEQFETQRDLEFGALDDFQRGLDAFSYYLHMIRRYTSATHPIVSALAKLEIQLLELADGVLATARGATFQNELLDFLVVCRSYPRSIFTMPRTTLLALHYRAFSSSYEGSLNRPLTELLGAYSLKGSVLKRDEFLLLQVPEFLADDLFNSSLNSWDAVPAPKDSKVLETLTALWDPHSDGPLATLEAALASAQALN